MIMMIIQILTITIINIKHIVVLLTIIIIMMIIRCGRQCVVLGSRQVLAGSSNARDRSQTLSPRDTFEHPNTFALSPVLRDDRRDALRGQNPDTSLITCYVSHLMNVTYDMLHHI